MAAKNCYTEKQTTISGKPILFSWRSYYPHQFFKDEVSEPVDAATIGEAMDLLGTRNMSNIQVLENGAWVWAA